jgi:exopolysaccharide biosynthesis polyprenyl glycosylphosphotransferase
MTPPPAATHAAQRIAFAPSENQFATSALARVLGVRAWPRIRFLADAIVLCLASVAALFVAPLAGSRENTLLALAFPMITLVIIQARHNPDQRLFASVFDIGAHVLGVVSLAAILTIAGDSILGGAHPVALALRLWVFSFIYLGLARVILLTIRRHLGRIDGLATPTLIVGAGVVGDLLAMRLLGEPRYGLRPVGFLDVNPLPRNDQSTASLVPVLGGPADLVDAVAATGARHVIVAFSSERDHILVEKVRECQQLGIKVSLIPRMYEAINERATVDHIGGLPLVSLQPTNPRSWQFAVKHAQDRTFAFVALVALAPVMIAIATGVALSSGGSVLFRQRRVGRDGRVFDVLKFRTMSEAPCTHEFELLEGSAPGGVEGEDRRTGFGRWLRRASLDELPQLINVLRGDMSLVGPRPERPEYVERFATEVARYQDRHRVKSGITGWAQVNGLRGQTSIADRVEWDNYYIQNWSPRFDLRIIALTVVEVLRFRG